MHDHLKVVIVVLVVVLTVGIFLLCRCDSKTEGFDISVGEVGWPTMPLPVEVPVEGYHHYPVSPVEYAELLS